jgi:hypothetical protein
MACEAEAAKPTNGRKNSEITALPMCNGQRLVKSLQAVIISMMSHIPTKVDGIQIKEKVEPMIVSKKPNHSLGGYSHQERCSRTRRKEKKGRQFFNAGHYDEQKDKEQIFWSLYPKKFDYSLGGYSHRERWSRTRCS